MFNIGVNVMNVCLLLPGEAMWNTEAGANLIENNGRQVLDARALFNSIVLKAYGAEFLAKKMKDEAGQTVHANAYDAPGENNAIWKAIVATFATLKVAKSELVDWMGDRRHALRQQLNKSKQAQRENAGAAHEK